MQRLGVLLGPAVCADKTVYTGCCFVGQKWSPAQCEALDWHEKSKVASRYTNCISEVVANGSRVNSIVAIEDDFSLELGK